MYDEITHIPFLAMWPEHIPADTRSSALVSHLDLSGTLMDFFGFEVPKTLEGRSMLATLRNPTATTAGPRIGEPLSDVKRPNYIMTRLDAIYWERLTVAGLSGLSAKLHTESDTG